MEGPLEWKFKVRRSFSHNLAGFPEQMLGWMCVQVQVVKYVSSRFQHSRARRGLYLRRGTQSCCMAEHQPHSTAVQDITNATLQAGPDLRKARWDQELAQSACSPENQTFTEQAHQHHPPRKPVSEVSRSRSYVCVCRTCYT